MIKNLKCLSELTARGNRIQAAIVSVMLSKKGRECLFSETCRSVNEALTAETQRTMTVKWNDRQRSENNSGSEEETKGTDWIRRAVRK